MAAELSACLGRRAHAAELLTQAHVPVWHTPAVVWIVGPCRPPIDIHRVIIKVVHVDNVDMAVRPVESAEEESRTDADSYAPGEPYTES